MSRAAVSGAGAMTSILGRSPAVQELLTLINRVGPSKTNILIIGESGTGKELVARMIHESGPLKDKPFVPVNCGAIPENLIESELFGHRKGSFTGAVSEKMGLFSVADGGTIFLDEVGELPVSMQVKLLRALQERIIRKVGGTEDIKVDARIIAATNRDLEAGVAKGTFREDLYYRLNVILIKTPPLRSRVGDIRILAEHFLHKSSARLKKTMDGFEDQAMAALEAHDWPGNVRELENIVERAATLETGRKVNIQSLPGSFHKVPVRTAATAAGGPTQSLSKDGSSSQTGEIRLPPPDFSKGMIPLDQILGDVERAYLLAAIKQAGGVKKKAAALLGITFRSIRYRLAKLGMESEKD